MDRLLSAVNWMRRVSASRTIGFHLTLWELPNFCLKGFLDACCCWLKYYISKWHGSRGGCKWMPLQAWFFIFFLQISFPFSVFLSSFLFSVFLYNFYFLTVFIVICIFFAGSVVLCGFVLYCLYVFNLGSVPDLRCLLAFEVLSVIILVDTNKDVEILKNMFNYPRLQVNFKNFVFFRY